MPQNENQTYGVTESWADNPKQVPNKSFADLYNGCQNILFIFSNILKRHSYKLASNTFLAKVHKAARNIRSTVMSCYSE